MSKIHDSENFFEFGYYYDEKVSVIKLYEVFHLVKIKILRTNEIRLVDKNAITRNAYKSNSLSIQLFGGGIK